MIHFFLLYHGVEVDPIVRMILLTLDFVLTGVVVLRIYDVLSRPKFAEIADERRDRWFAEHPEEEVKS